ncbi:hypothetical protein [Streptomyces sp. NPDC058548]
MERNRLGFSDRVASALKGRGGEGAAREGCDAARGRSEERAT